MNSFDIMYNKWISSEESKDTHGKLSVLSNILYGDNVTTDFFSDVTYCYSLSCDGLDFCAAVFVTIKSNHNNYFSLLNNWEGPFKSTENITGS